MTTTQTLPANPFILARAAQWLAELDEGRGFGVMTREYISDLLALCAAINAWLGR